MLDVLLSLLILLIIVAVVGYILNTYVVIDPHLRNLIMFILGIVIVIWLILALVGAAPLIPLRRAP